MSLFKEFKYLSGSKSSTKPLSIPSSMAAFKCMTRFHPLPASAVRHRLPHWHCYNVLGRFSLDKIFKIRPERNHVVFMMLPSHTAKLSIFHNSCQFEKRDTTDNINAHQKRNRAQLIEPRPVFYETSPSSCCSATNKRGASAKPRLAVYFTSSNGTSVTVPLLPAP